LNQTK